MPTRSPVRTILRRILLGLGVSCGIGAALAAPPPAFVHPGVLVDAAHLAYIKTQIAVGTAPYADAFAAARASHLGSPNYAAEGPPASGVIDCGPYSKPDHGCSQENNDASAAYTQALLWSLTSDPRYAHNAIAIMNRYARKLRAHTGSNAPLQAAWSAEKWPAAAELIRYSDAGWSDEDFAAFSKMLREKYLPLLTGGQEAGKNGNWALSMIDATLGIAVLTDDHDLFDATLQRWQRWVPAYYYSFALDGPHPVMLPEGPADWNGQTQFDPHTSGVTQETCRDTQHAQLGLAATFNAAETAYLQGVDLYTPNAIRLTISLEYLARLLYGTRNLDQHAQLPIPDGFPGLCDGQSYTPVLKATMERAYYAYAVRLGIALPRTRAHLQDDVRPAAPPDDRHDALWETLTNGALIPSDTSDAGAGDAPKPAADQTHSSTPADLAASVPLNTSLSAPLHVQGIERRAPATDAATPPADAIAAPLTTPAVTPADTLSPAVQP